MPEFFYKAKDLTGKEISGRFTCGSKSEIVAMLGEKGFFLTDLKDEKQKRKIFSLGEKVTSKDLAMFCRQFSVLLEVGITISDSISIMKEQTENKTLKNALVDVHETIYRGKLLSQAMEMHKNVFPEFLVNMVKIGETSGFIDDVVKKMADYYENDSRVKNKVKSAMTYPVILLIIMGVVLSMLTLKVVPMFKDILDQMSVELPLATKIMITVSNFTVKYIVLIIAVIALLVYLISKYLKSMKGRLWFDGFILKVPIAGKTVTKLVTARFARSMAILLKSGIPILSAMDIVGGLIGNKFIEAKFKKCREEIREGKGIKEPISRLGVFPPMLIHMISVGESSGELDEMLARTAGFFDEEVSESLQKLTTLIEPVLLVIMAVIVAVVILSVMLPMVGMMGAI